MAGNLEKTTERGIYKRGDTYTYSVRVNGEQKWFTARTLDQARRDKRARTTDRDRGEYNVQSKVTLYEYIAEDWIERYRGTGKRGFREETRSEYRGIIEKYYFRPDGFFVRTLKVAELDPAMVDRFVHWLAKQPGRRGPTLSDNSIRNTLSPLRSAMASARREGLIKSNPVDGVALPRTARIEEDEERPRPFPPGTLQVVLDLINPRYRTMFDLLAVTGLRRSELLALQGKHLSLNGDQPTVKIRQRVRRLAGHGLIIGPVKSRYSRRDLPLPLDVADQLRALRTAPDELVFRTRSGGPHEANNIAQRVLAPACAEAGVEWAGMHTFRHHVASRLFAEGRSIKVVQEWLGHHSAAFTLQTYIHLMPGDGIGGPLALPTAPVAKLQPMSANGVSANGADRHSLAVEAG